MQHVTLEAAFLAFLNFFVYCKECIVAVTLNGPFGQLALGATTLTIGRALDNQLVINDAQVSGRHAQIFLEAQGYSIMDMGSTNGTFINEYQLRPNTPLSLHPGDRIRLGKTIVLTYEVSAVSPSDKTVPDVPIQIPPTQPLTTSRPPAYGRDSNQHNYTASPFTEPPLPTAGQYTAPPQPLPGLTIPQPELQRKGTSRRKVMLGLGVLALLAVGGSAAVIYAPRLHLHLGFPNFSPNNPATPDATASATTPTLAATYQGTMTSTTTDGSTADITLAQMMVTQDQNQTISGQMTCNPAQGRSGPITGSFSTNTQFTFLVTGTGDGTSTGFPTTFSGVVNADQSLSGKYKTIGINFNTDPSNPDDDGTWTAKPA